MKNPSSHYLHRLLTDCMRRGPNGEPTLFAGETQNVLDEYAEDKNSSMTEARRIACLIYELSMNDILNQNKQPHRRELREAYQKLSKKLLETLGAEVK